MSSVDCPHFDLPFRFVISGGIQTPAVVEQDTLDDVVNCVVASLRTHIGWRPEQPGFGTRELELQLQPLDLSEIIRQVTKDEPRAVMFLEQHPDQVDVLIDRISIMVSTRGGQT